MSEEAKKLYAPVKLIGENKWLEPVFKDAQSSGVNYVFVVRPLNNPDNPILEHGPGVICRSIGSDPNATAYMQISIQLWSAKTQELLFSKPFWNSDLMQKTQHACDPSVSFGGEFEALVKSAVSTALAKSGLVPQT